KYSWRGREASTQAGPGQPATPSGRRPAPAVMIPPSLGRTRGASVAPHFVIWWVPGDPAAPFTGRPLAVYQVSEASSAMTSPTSAAASPAIAPDRASISESVRPEAFLRRWVWYARPVPAGIRRPTITFSFRPRRP